MIKICVIINTMLEKWKPIPGYKGFYEISDFGRVRSINRIVPHSQGPRKRRGKILRQIIHRQGYPRVDLCRDGKKIRYYVHRLIAERFISNPNNLPCVCHKDDNPMNLYVDNLFWGTHKDNMNDMTSKGRANKFTRPIFCVETGEIFQSVKAAADEHNVSQSTIRQSVTTHYRAAGYHWEFV